MLSKDFKEFIELLNSNEVKYLLIGAYAVALHGHPRYTKDLDIWVELSTENAEKLDRAIKEFGFGSLKLTKEDFLTEGTVIQMGHPPNRIDIINSPDGINFAESYSSRLQLDLDGTKVSVIDLENLLKNKRASGRTQDLA